MDARHDGFGWRFLRAGGLKLRAFDGREATMQPMRWIVMVVIVWTLALPAFARTATPPPVELVDVYHGGVDLSRYWVSEKFDGVRGYWDGH
jgi:hypothetical protein